ncbi:hypothetical protein D3C86_1576270 [compost metagenome]
MHAVETIADHHPSDHHADPRAQPLQGTPGEQPLDARRQHAQQRGAEEQAKAEQEEAPATDGVGNRAVPEQGQGKRQQVGGERLLHLDGRRRQLLGDGGERRHVGGNGELAHGGQAGDQQDKQLGIWHSGS